MNLHVHPKHEDAASRLFFSHDSFLYGTVDKIIVSKECSKTEFKV